MLSLIYIKPEGIDKSSDCNHHFEYIKFYEYVKDRLWQVCCLTVAKYPDEVAGGRD